MSRAITGPQVDQVHRGSINGSACRRSSVRDGIHETNKTCRIKVLDQDHQTESDQRGTPRRFHCGFAAKLGEKNQKWQLSTSGKTENACIMCCASSKRTRSRLNVYLNRVPLLNVSFVNPALCRDASDCKSQIRCVGVRCSTSEVSEI